MKKFYISLLLICWLSSITLAQQQKPTGGGAYTPPVFNCVSGEQRQHIVQMLDTNSEMLRERGRLSSDGQRAKKAAFAWPLKQSQGFSDPSYYAITNYVDHDPDFPSKLIDYNCGTRTYDIASGYNHTGTDIQLWPFARVMQSKNQVQVIAAEAGTIIGKEDQNTDENCTMCSNCNWNAIYVQHADGSVAWYGHLKKNTLTLKGVGKTVEKGEFLGFVGSSGSSTAPHLHFEVYKSTTYNAANRIDPFAGECNTLNGNDTYWEDQKAYREPTINKIMTHSAAPNYNDQLCPALEVINEENSFQRGQHVLFASYFHDQLVQTSANYVVYTPSNQIFQSWTLTSPSSYSASWWYWTYILPANAPYGVWRYEVTYNGQKVTHNFTVGAPASVSFSAGELQENQPVGTLVGNLSSASDDPNDSFTYSLKAGEGDTDNTSFTINGNKINTAAVLDYEQKKTYNVRLQSMNKRGLSLERQMEIAVKDVNEQPTAITINKNNIDENNAKDVAIGSFTSTDPDGNDTHAYTLSDEGNSDNAYFTVEGNVLKASEIFDYEVKSSYHVHVQTKDSGGLIHKETLVISINDVQESVTGISEEEKRILKVYPNPTVRFLVIRSEETVEHISIVNMYGSTVLTKQPHFKETELDLNLLASGIYIALVSSRGKVYRRQIVVVK
ncbi:cadherin domain-containing protein [Pontibacter toksunensis]|uniref:Cadherin domain-containing protein n=1 Tax=Pontibacter toksunensis TaxID=1332631 RepID=A0ABW6C067_9BACT